jgi:TrmH family RNA methyltransferase
MKTIRSDSNPTYRGWLALAAQRRAARAAPLALAEGLHLAQAALASDTPIAGYVLRRGALAPGGELGPIVATLEARAVPGYELGAALYDRLEPVERGAGLLLLVARHSHPVPMDSADDLVFLDGVQDPGNLGTLLRIAAAAGVRHVLGGVGCAAFWSPKALRAAMGAHFRLRLSELVGVAALPGALDGTWIACEAHAARSLWSTDFGSGALGWVFGSEGGGISPPAAAICRQRVRVPLADGVESLNVAAAAAVCLFERRRRGAD